MSHSLMSVVQQHPTPYICPNGPLVIKAPQNTQKHLQTSVMAVLLTWRLVCNHFGTGPIIYGIKVALNLEKLME